MVKGAQYRLFYPFGIKAAAVLGVIPGGAETAGGEYAGCRCAQHRDIGRHRRANGLRNLGMK
ncbi:hypothetical protein D3C75_1023280 [compost metagenome]